MNMETIMYKHWWQKKTNEHEGVFDIIRALRDDISLRNVDFRRYIEMYMNRTINIGTGIGAMGFSPSYGTPAQGASTSLGKAYRGARTEPRVIVNASESCISTLASRIASQRPTPEFLTTISGPDVWGMQLKAEQLKKFVVGKWLKKKLYKKMVKVFIDMCVCGFGAMKVYSKDNDIEYERIFPPEFIIDERAALTGDPNMAYVVKNVPAEVLKYEYPGNDKEIDRAKGGQRNLDYNTGRVLTTDMIFVVEAWHLPSGKDAGDGKHVICIENKTLFSEEWKRPRFPFAIFRYTEPPFGWYPPGLMEQQEPLQVQVNKLLYRIQKAMNIHSVSKTFLEEGSLVGGKKQLRNNTGDIIWMHKGARPPQVFMPPSASSEIFKHAWELYNKIFENSGVSQLSASSKKPAGLESGKALRTLGDFETGRHALLNQTFDDGFMELCELTVDEAKDIYSRSGEFKSNYPERNYVETIDWKDVNMERDQYELQIFPSSSLPMTPAGRLQSVEELIASGLITSEQGKELLSFPDLERFASLDQAGMRLVDKMIGDMLQGESRSPEPYLPLASGIARVTHALLWAQFRGAPQDILELLLEWIAAAREMLVKPPEPIPQVSDVVPESDIGGAPGMPVGPPVDQGLPQI
jgi:hypothetical protein